jgi:hypothetical protein
MAVAKSKVIQTELMAIYAVAADVQKISSELDLTEIGKVAVFIDHAKDHGSAAVGQGTEYVIQVSEKATGNDTWRAVWSGTAAITAPTLMVTDTYNLAGTTALQIGSAVPPMGDIVFFRNYAVLGDSEWANIVGRGIVGGAEYVYLESGLAIYQAAGYVYGYGEHFMAVVDVDAFTRMRVVCNNTKGTTNRPIVWRCGAITSPI